MQNLPRHEHYIGGEEVPPTSGEHFPSRNPATGQPWYEAASGADADVRRAVSTARTAFERPSWRDLSQTARGRLLRRLAELIGEHAEDLARTESLDNGKLLREMRGQLAGIPEYLHYYAGYADKPHGDVIPGSSTSLLNYTMREPLGVVGVITPWNSPLLLTVAKIAPALAAGNTVVIKPSEHTSASLLRLAPLFELAGFPPGVVNVVTGFGHEAGSALVEHEDVAKISFTGSTETGSRIAASAGARFVPATLELGGKSPNIVFSDADTDNAAMGIVAGIFAAAGQTCIAGSRVFLQRPIYEEVLKKVVDRASSIAIGDPLEDTTELGPVAFAEQLDKIERYVELGRSEGQLLCGGYRPETGLGGYFYAPTVFAGASNEARICQEEIFGPVLTVLPFDEESELVAMANNTEYGLAAGVWTRDLARAHRLASALDAGTVWVNTYRAMAPTSPRSGFKRSGMGIEHGAEALHEYTRLKSVWVNTDESPTGDPFVMRS